MDGTAAPDPTRRDVLGKACAAAACGACAFAAVPAVNYLVPRPEPKPTGPVAVAKVDDIPDGGAKIVLYGGIKVLVVRSGKALAAMAATCTHLACLVEWDGKDRLVRCNCHGGVFAADGKRLSGPPPRDLVPFRASVKGGRVFLES